MPLLLAALASATFGVADFLGGIATRRSSALSVVWASQVAAFVVVAAVSPFTADGLPPRTDMLWGAAAGVAGSFGLVIFYHALAVTRIGVAAPVAAVIGTSLPVVFGVVVGERPSALAWCGIVLALPAVAVLSGGSRAGAGSSRRAAVLGTVAGVAFALFGILVSRTGADSGLWPLTAARFASLAFAASVAGIRRRPLQPGADVWPLAAAVGLLDMTANALFLVAVRQEMLSLVAVIMSLYPVTTIALAHRVLGERVSRRQWSGFSIALLAAVAIALG